MVTRGKQLWMIIIIISDGSYNECTHGEEPLIARDTGQGWSLPHFFNIITPLYNCSPFEIFLIFSILFAYI